MSAFVEEPNTEGIETILIGIAMIEPPPQDEPPQEPQKRRRGRPSAVCPSKSTQYQREWKAKNRERWNDYQKNKIQKIREENKIAKYLQYITEKLKR